MEEKCNMISDSETLSLVTSGSGEEKDTIIYVIPFEGNETLFQSDRTLNQNDDPGSVFLGVDESSLNLLSSDQNVTMPETTVIVIDEAKARQEKEDKERERARLAAQAMESFTDRRRRKREDKNSTKFVDNVETDLEMANEVFSCPVCEAVFSRSNAFYGHLQTHSGKGTVFRCGDCSKDFESLAKLWKHEKIHSNFRPFVCPQCSKTFERQSQLTYHIQRIHEEKRPYSCELCSKSFHKNSDLRQHRHVHMGIKKHVCPDCGRAFNHVSNLNRHQRTHNNEKPYVCSECHRRFTQLSALNAHSSTHSQTGRKSGRSKSTLACPECNLIFRSEGVFKAHIQSEHASPSPASRKFPASSSLPASKSFHCRVCGLKFPFVSELKSHYFAHENETEFPCQACKRSYPYIDQLLTHECHTQICHNNPDQTENVEVEATEPEEDVLVSLQREVDELAAEGPNNNENVMEEDTNDFIGKDQGDNHDNFDDKEESDRQLMNEHPDNLDESKLSGKKCVCEICERVFSRKDSLLQHMGLHNNDFAVWKCDACDEKFAWKSSLKKHKIRVHQNEPWPSIPCDICTRTFRTLGHKKIHIQRDHLKIRDFKCEVCFKTFFLKGDLVTHQRTHFPEKPFQCSMCVKSFKHISHKIRHELTHRNEQKQFTCELCKRGFSKRTPLVQHFKKVHTDMDIRHLELLLDQ